ncbi:hypothetical protein EVAR_44789_1 [Eumeta japonica]|uniref:Uncharacterized protein n=1 Tax=Eumeta variegata TaxID=151549 RepID=A0A4C1Y5B7_EUMVA|nr:hypothetical protein EVAR_44789_1 [Eumeta japonica]
MMFAGIAGDAVVSEREGKFEAQACAGARRDNGVHQEDLVSAQRSKVDSAQCDRLISCFRGPSNYSFNAACSDT